MTLVSCEKEKVYGRHKVLILYSAGFNNLSSYLLEDIKELSEGLVYPKHSSKGAILIFGRHTRDNGGKYTPEIAPCLIHLYKDDDGSVTADTLLTFTKDTKAANKSTMYIVLSHIKRKFPSQHYGMIFSSHATGWLPKGYYSNPVDEEDGNIWGSKKKSIGADYEMVDGERISHEMEITEMAYAIPMKLDYLLFDACLMGGVEVAYELRKVCDKVGFSQAEVLADGYNYTNLASHLIDFKVSSPEQVCKDYYEQYAKKSGVYQSATISLIKTSELEPLAQLCGRLFDKYREEILTLDKKSVQRYYRYKYHWFYDLQSIIIQAGATEEELAELEQALSACVIYKAATPGFMEDSGGFPIDIFSGLSMYLPDENWPTLNNHYKTLAWNKATNLVNF